MAYGRQVRRRSRPLWRRIAGAILVMALLAGVAVLAAWLERFSQTEIAGVARVVDGDSLALGARRLRLKGIDAPELRQRCRRDGLEYGCGEDAASHLRELLGDGPIDCRGEGVDRYGRDMVRCTAGGLDLNEAMVRSGHAVAYGDYRRAEAAARSSRAGLWAGEFDQPERWRAVHGGLNENLDVGWGSLMAFLRRLFGV